MSELQQQVQKVIDELVETGTERGVQVAVFQGGEQVVDAVAGVADPATGRPVSAGTVFYNYSVGKAATSTIIHRLAERGCSATTPRWPSCGRPSPPTASRPSPSA